jgi:predicted nucleic acid-binding protein
LSFVVDASAAAEWFLDEAIRLTAELDQPIYDCLYIALARDLDFLLITADRCLQARTVGTRLTPLVRALADISAS